MIITIKEVSEEIIDGVLKYVQWKTVDAANKEHILKLYPLLQVNEQWISFADRIDEFRQAKDKTYEIERKSIKKEKGYWQPVTKATLIKDVFVQEAVRKVADDTEALKRQSIETQNALNVISQEHIWNQLDKGTQLAIIAYLLNKMNITQAKFEPSKVIEIKLTDIPQPLGESPADIEVEETEAEIIEPALEWASWFKEVLPLIHMTQRDLTDIGLPVRDARKTDSFHYVKDILNGNQRKKLFTLMNKKLEPENRIEL